jgi:hypothetical protein
VENVGSFSPNLKVKTTFAVQLPMQSRGQVVTDLKNEVSAGFISRQRAIKRLNPELSEGEIQELISEIDTELNGDASTESIDTDSGGSETSPEEGTGGLSN